MSTAIDLTLHPTTLLIEAQIHPNYRNLAPIARLLRRLMSLVQLEPPNNVNSSSNAVNRHSRRAIYL